MKSKPKHSDKGKNKIESIELLRKEIDKLDNQLVEILNQRLTYVLTLGKQKKEEELGVYNPQREKEIIHRLSQNNQGKPLTEEAIASIMSEIFSVSRKEEFPVVVAYLGPKGSFTHQAANTRFGEATKYKSLTSIKSVIEAVGSERVKFGVVPIENNSQGMVGETIDYLGTQDMHIVAEIVIPIHFCFASRNEKLDSITKVYSKDVAFNQCRDFINNYLNINKTELIPVESTSKATVMAKEDPLAGAICSQISAKMRSIPVLFKNIEDETGNHTRFYVLSKEVDMSVKKNANFTENEFNKSKTTIITKLYNDTEPGKLYDFLKDFKDENINIIKLTSHPAKEGSKFRYWFFLEFDGHVRDKKIKALMEKHASHVKVLGSYPKVV